MTPLQELSVLCGLMVIGESKKDLASKKDLVCRAEFVSMSKSPDRKRLTELGSPPIPINALWIAKGDCFDISLFEKDNIKNLVLAAIPLTRRRIPFDFQRTSLAGLALESATSSGLGRAPRSAMQDPIQAPTGTTRQAGLYTS
ncbi:hypothetical protein TNCV_3937971 [Trichonephila clavipes]|nr:hypothetical protein TNCV_3937971 [Trichonephila clavipes]